MFGRAEAEFEGCAHVEVRTEGDLETEAVEETETEGAETETVEETETEVVTGGEAETVEETELDLEIDSGFGRNDLGFEALGDISQRLSLGEGKLTLELLLLDGAVPCGTPQGTAGRILLAVLCGTPQGTADGRTRPEDG